MTDLIVRRQDFDHDGVSFRFSADHQFHVGLFEDGERRTQVFGGAAVALDEAAAVAVVDPARRVAGLLAADVIELLELEICHLLLKLIEENVFRHQSKATTVLSYHRCLINTGVEKMTYI